MPPLSQTFIRQKIMSSSNILKTQIQNSSQYLETNNVILQSCNKTKHLNTKNQPKQNSILKFLINLR